MKNVLYLSFNGFYEYNGISKKKIAQINGLKECGCRVVNCYYSVNLENRHRIWMVDNEVLVDLGKGIQAKVRKRIAYGPILEYIKENQISFIYMRSDHNASPFLIRFVENLHSMGVKITMEIPTYPYDQEYNTFIMKVSLFFDRLFRKKLAKQLDAIVTFSNETTIFDQNTIRISNGIDFSSLKLKQNNHVEGELHLIGVAEIHFWHGFDRVVAGLADYYRNSSDTCKVYFHIVGEFSGEREKNEIVPLIKKNCLENYVTLHGRQFGEELDVLFDRADVGIGCLARHRSGITFIKTLKNREYSARGIPFIYSETDEDFEEMPYVLKAPADESPINMHQLIDFYHSLRISSEEICNSVMHLSWKNQMQKVLKSLFT